MQEQVFRIVMRETRIVRVQYTVLATSREAASRRAISGDYIESQDLEDPTIVDRQELNSEGDRRDLQITDVMGDV